MKISSTMYDKEIMKTRLQLWGKEMLKMSLKNTIGVGLAGCGVDEMRSGS